MDKILTVAQAAKKLKVTRAAIYAAIAKDRLQTFKKDGKYLIHLKDLIIYESFRYSRDFSVRDGELVFDRNKGRCSVRDASSIMRVNDQKIYYWLRMGYLKHVRNGKFYVIDLKDIQNFSLIDPK